MNCQDIAVVMMVENSPRTELRAVRGYINLDVHLIIFARIFQVFEMFSRVFSHAPSRYGARIAANQKWHFITSML